jgi:hypothetical protein
MSAFVDFRTAVLDGVEALAKDLLHGNVQAAREDAETFIANSGDKLQRWTKLLAEGQLTQDEFAALVRSQKDLAEMNALSLAGISAARAQVFRDKMVAVVIDSAFKVLLPI